LPVDELTNPNFIEITGFVCKKPIYRMTPFKREICDVLIAVNRAYNKSDYIPCIMWGRNARYIQNMPIGEKITICGRIQSRSYVKSVSENESVERVAYEVSVSKILNVDEVEKEVIVEENTTTQAILL
ncbi:MAG: single-stranded DNA-binding protein, partial [Clostridia bacterium]